MTLRFDAFGGSPGVLERLRAALLRSLGLVAAVFEQPPAT